MASPPAGLTVLTHSSTLAYDACPRRFQLAYLQLFRAVKVALPLTIGTKLHRILEAFWRAIQQGLDAKTVALEAVVREFSGYELARFRPLIDAYASVWLTHTWEVLAIEVKFRMPLRDADGRVSTRFVLEGKIDRILRGPDGILRLCEVKSAGVDVSEGSVYRQRLALDEQISMYCDGAESLGYTVDRVTYDVLVKPRIQPKQATPANKRVMVQDRKAKQTRLKSTQRERDETTEEFEARVAALIAQDPAAFIVRFPVPRDANRAPRFRRNLANCSRHIALDLESGFFAEKSQSCEQPGRRCQFAPHCLGGVPLADTTTFTRVNTMHVELEEDSSDSEDAELEEEGSL